jgi:hypothetical protein
MAISYLKHSERVPLGMFTWQHDSNLMASTSMAQIGWMSRVARVDQKRNLDRPALGRSPDGRLSGRGPGGLLAEVLPRAHPPEQGNNQDLHQTLSKRQVVGHKPNFPASMQNGFVQGAIFVTLDRRPSKVLNAQLRVSLTGPTRSANCCKLLRV